MNEVVKEYLTNYAKRLGFNTDNNTLFEILREGNRVYSQKKRSHRWYDVLFVVVNIDGREIGFDDIYMTGDHNASDMGIDYDLESVCEVVKKEKTITYYEKYNP